MRWPGLYSLPIAGTEVWEDAGRGRPAIIYLSAQSPIPPSYRADAVRRIVCDAMRIRFFVRTCRLRTCMHVCMHGYSQSRLLRWMVLHGACQGSPRSRRPGQDTPRAQRDGCSRPVRAGKRIPHGHRQASSKYLPAWDRRPGQPLPSSLLSSRPSAGPHCPGLMSMNGPGRNGGALLQAARPRAAGAVFHQNPSTRVHWHAITSHRAKTWMPPWKAYDQHFMRRY